MHDYLKADRLCDLVMKGGITSGIVYPPAIDRIAERFWLCGIGGTSAGAIAAALAAAAEYCSRRGSGAGFEALRRLPTEIAASGRLLSLFKPDASTRALFDDFLRGTRLKRRGALGPSSGSLLMSPGSFCLDRPCSPSSTTGWDFVRAWPMRTVARTSNAHR